MTRQPCASCPWRLDQDATAIPGFVLAKAEALAATSPDERGMGPGWGSPMFACHQSRDGQEVVCAGWLAQVGAAHPGVRLALMQGTMTPDQVQPQTGLHTTFQEVIRKLRATTRPSGGTE